MTTLDLQGTLRISNGSEAAGRVLTSDGDGIATWSGGPHFIGETYGGGIVFYVYDNGQHGLIVSSGFPYTDSHWNNGGINKLTGTSGGNGLGAGSMNTAMIVAAEIGDYPTPNFAAMICADYTVVAGGLTYGDWYLPSLYELNLLYLQKSLILVSFGTYWSSLESGATGAMSINFSNGTAIGQSKNIINVVRPIRSF
jgi:hypothetical protein